MNTDIKQVQPYYLKTRNVQWIRSMAQKLSTPAGDISASAFLDRLLDEARERTEAEEAGTRVEPPMDHTPTGKQKKTALVAASA